MKLIFTKAKFSQVNQWSFLFLVIMIFPIAVIPYLDGNDDIFIEITFGMLATQSAFLMIFLNGIFGKIYYLFSYFFFSITPWLQFKNSIVFWGFPQTISDVYAEINCILIALNFMYFLSYILGIGTQKKISSIASNQFLITKHQYKFLSLVVFVSSYIIFYLAGFNFENILFRNGEIGRVEVEQTVGLLLVPIYFLPFICVAFYLLNQKKTHLKLLILVLPMILVLFPTGLPRNFTGLIYLTLLLIILPWLRVGNRLVIFVLICLIFVFPLLENFRSYDHEQYELMPSYDFFLAPHFDSYQSFAVVYQYKIITFGYQLLGPLLFFIPRVYWDEKPIGSGHFVAHMFELPFTNISSNIYAEGFVNFGVTGCAIFSIVLGFFGGKFSHQLSSNQESIPKKLVLYGAIAYFVYFLRGDLMSPVAYFSSYVFCIFLVWFILKLINYKKST